MPVKFSVQERLSLRFPIRDNKGNAILTGAVTFNLAQLREAEIFKDRGRGRRPSRMPLVYSSDYAQEVATSLLANFWEWVPAIAVIKDSQGHLLDANQRFFKVTRKSLDAIGGLPSDNWQPATADLIIAHDQLVRETQAPFLSVETIEADGVSFERLNLRFPIFGSDGAIQMIGVLGFDYGLIRLAIETLSGPNGHRQVCVFDPDGQGVKEFVEVLPDYSADGAKVAEE
jgi:hypothetical protein